MGPCKWLPVARTMKVQAQNLGEKIAVEDKDRRFTFREWNERTNRLNHVLQSMGVGKGDRFAAIAYNRIEWMELYAAAANGGQVIVPVMFRLAAPEIEYIINHSEAKAIIVSSEFVERIEAVRSSLKTIPPGNFIYLGDGTPPSGYVSYEMLLDEASPDEPGVMVEGDDPWMIMYTSGTTGRPKGVVRDHESTIAEFLINITELGFRQDDKGLLVMPMCHINSVFYSFVFTYMGASCHTYKMVSFDPEDLLRTIEKYRITFVSLVPTHYIMMLSHPNRERYDVSSIRKLLCSSAPVRRDTKVAILEFFKNAELFEIYGSTEAGSVTILRPEDQMRKPTSIGREVMGSDPIRVLDENRREVSVGEVGELYSRSPELFSEYWKDPDLTRKCFVDGWFSAGDMAKRDEEGFYYLVDRKANMIITGGENVYPSEVENVVGSHSKVKDVAVIGIPHEKWGEAVHAVVILHEGQQASAEEIIEFCRGSIAGYKIPKSVDFISDAEMPRTATGKILHRILRDRYQK